ncbi:helix-turn-helix transcriptional regulator [Burkholderia pseudomallei]|uniref:helix-turn-helix transcriptional regulator n=2 Tax=Burkholderia pseudomallei TaxID=28450 RepID=UPI000F09828E|nr:helix-turn-helix transcriptional regulator [Burkholderia pseudomallei]
MAVPPSDQRRAPPLTSRELQVSDLLRAGLSNKMIAAQLGISLDTARRYSSRVKRKIDIPSSFALPCLEWANQLDWLEKLDLGSYGLSKSEIRVLWLLCRGMSSKIVARLLSISPRTVDKHRENIRRKFGVSSSRMLTAFIASQYAKCGIGESSDKA